MVGDWDGTEWLLVVILKVCSSPHVHTYLSKRREKRRRLIRWDAHHCCNHVVVLLCNDWDSEVLLFTAATTKLFTVATNFPLSCWIRD